MRNAFRQSAFSGGMMIRVPYRQKMRSAVIRQSAYSGGMMIIVPYRQKKRKDRYQAGEGRVLQGHRAGWDIEVGA